MLQCGIGCHCIAKHMWCFKKGYQDIELVESKKLKYTSMSQQQSIWMVMLISLFYGLAMHLDSQNLANHGSYDNFMTIWSVLMLTRQPRQMTISITTVVIDKLDGLNAMKQNLFLNIMWHILGCCGIEQFRKNVIGKQCALHHDFF